MKTLVAVTVRIEKLAIPTYLPAPPDKNPMFLEKRVYQGSSGRVYPLPFTDRIAETKADRLWTAVYLENEFLQVMLLPELGGRVHAILDKTNGYDLIYRQEVIKPALVGLAGPWASGGVEFNWPQHHRPATFMPVDFHVEEHADGAKTVWCSDHDPMSHLKGMHGLCLHPGRAYVEVKARVTNRTPFTQTFLWWANMAIKAHESIQSFFPSDVHCVADHARRAISAYPLCEGTYYGVNYGARARGGVPPHERPTQFVPPHCGGQAPVKYAPNDLSFYANIPTPCSYMCLGTREDFCGAYDHAAQAGIVLLANHHIAPGKKQWTWGNHPFGYAWDRNLTDANAQGEFSPYIELMSGVYTDNQPDFSFLQAGETRTWSQHWFPIQRIGPAQYACPEGAASLKLADGKIHLGISVTAAHETARIRLQCGRKAWDWAVRLAPGESFKTVCPAPKGAQLAQCKVSVEGADGRQIMAYQPRITERAPAPAAATEPLPPEKVPSADELYVIGLHLDQYRHATRCPSLYWNEALRRDPLDARCNNALGLWRLRRGEFGAAEKHFRQAIQRLTERNPNPADGEPFYNLGQCLRYQLDACATRADMVADPRFEEACAAFYKATWNQAWASAAFHALAEMDCQRQEWGTALTHLERALRLNQDNMRARNLQTMVLQRLGQTSAAESWSRETLALDPLDGWARHLAGQALSLDWQARLDVAHDYARAGFYAEAIFLLSEPEIPQGDLPDQSWGALPLVYATIGWLGAKLEDSRGALRAYKQAAAQKPDYCFPARWEEVAILQAMIQALPKDAKAPYYLGNLLYDRRRHEEAIQCWEQSARLDPSYSVVWRNLGIGYFNIRHQPAKARAAYQKACEANPRDARLLYERDQLWKRLGDAPAKRLAALEKQLDLARLRDDLSVELCALYNQTNQPERALEILGQRKFQPWEGGEGGPLGQHVRTHLALGRAAFARADYASAQSHFEQALAAPENLGEARHLLANPADVHYWLGCALDAQGETNLAREHWQRAAHFTGDFQEMSVRPFSEMTYYSALAQEKLGNAAAARGAFQALLKWAKAWGQEPAKIDYFATSLPTMLLFDDDLGRRQRISAQFVAAQALAGLGRFDEAETALVAVLKPDPNHPLAADLLGEIHARQGRPETGKSRATRKTSKH